MTDRKLHYNKNGSAGVTVPEQWARLFDERPIRVSIHYSTDGKLMLTPLDSLGRIVKAMTLMQQVARRNKEEIEEAKTLVFQEKNQRNPTEGRIRKFWNESTTEEGRPTMGRRPAILRQDDGPKEEKDGEEENDGFSREKPAESDRREDKEEEEKMEDDTIDELEGLGS